jgi:hypothetical protein
MLCSVMPPLTKFINGLKLSKFFCSERGIRKSGISVIRIRNISKISKISNISNISNISLSLSLSLSTVIRNGINWISSIVIVSASVSVSASVRLSLSAIVN